MNKKKSSKETFQEGFMGFYFKEKEVWIPKITRLFWVFFFKENKVQKDYFLLGTLPIQKIYLLKKVFFFFFFKRSARKSFLERKKKGIFFFFFKFRKLFLGFFKKKKKIF